MRLSNAFIHRENQIKAVTKDAANFHFRWHNLNAIHQCIQFHNHHRPDPSGYGNQSAAPQSERYEILEPSILRDKPVDNISSTAHLAHFIKLYPESVIHNIALNSYCNFALDLGQVYQPEIEEHERDSPYKN